MKIRNALFLLLALTSGLTTGVLRAQPPQPKPQPQQEGQRWLQRLQNMTPEQRQQLQQFLQNMTLEQRQQMQQQVQQQLQNLTPAQRQQMQQQMQELLQTPEQRREAWIRQVAGASGFTEVEMQNAIIAFIQAQEKARDPLRTAASGLSELLLNPALTNEQLQASLASFRALVAKDQERYQADLVVLDGKIKYSAQPRLEMLLGVLGVVGSETAILGGVGAIFPDSGFGSGLLTTAMLAPVVKN